MKKYALILLSIALFPLITQAKDVVVPWNRLLSTVLSTSK
jgi:hypothetical protein